MNFFSHGHRTRIRMVQLLDSGFANRFQPIDVPVTGVINKTQVIPEDGCRHSAEVPKIGSGDYQVREHMVHYS